MSQTLTDTLVGRIADYRNTGEQNDALHAEFTRLTDSVAHLEEHRDWVERNRWGFGDRAFHYLWHLIISDLAGRKTPLRALEIGVFKGQTISLWSLLGQENDADLQITAISPFEGNVKPMPRWQRILRSLFDREFRQAKKVGNLHWGGDFLRCVHQIFDAFRLPIAPVRLIKGYSNDPAVLEQARDEPYDLAYIDGDHSYEVACSDIHAYAPLVKVGGYLVMDDAAWFLPGETFWKGFESVSRACEELPPLGFENVLNVGHNRVYRRVR